MSLQILSKRNLKGFITLTATRMTDTWRVKRCIIEAVIAVDCKAACNMIDLSVYSIPFHSIILFQATRPIQTNKHNTRRQINSKAQKKHKHIYFRRFGGYKWQYIATATFSSHCFKCSCRYYSVVGCLYSRVALLTSHVPSVTDRRTGKPITPVCLMILSASASCSNLQTGHSSR